MGNRVRVYLFLGVTLLPFVSAAAQSGGGTLIGNFSPIAQGSNVNLSVIGKLDWVHWGLYTDTTINRKGSVTPLISNFSLLGDSSCPTCYLAEYQYSDNWNGYTWYDGAPAANVTNTTTGVWAYNYPNAAGSGFQLTVPADTSQRTLQVFVGAFAAQGQFKATMTSSFHAISVFSVSSAPSVDLLPREGRRPLLHERPRCLAVIAGHPGQPHV